MSAFDKFKQATEELEVLRNGKDTNTFTLDVYVPPNYTEAFTLSGEVLRRDTTKYRQTTLATKRAGIGLTKQEDVDKLHLNALLTLVSDVTLNGEKLKPSELKFVLERNPDCWDKIEDAAFDNSVFTKPQLRGLSSTQSDGSGSPSQAQKEAKQPDGKAGSKPKRQPKS